MGENFDVDPGGHSIRNCVKALRQVAIGRVEDTVESNGGNRDGQQALDDLYFVVQLFSYPGNYVDKNPNIERMPKHSINSRKACWTFAQPPSSLDAARPSPLENLSRYNVMAKRK